MADDTTTTRRDVLRKLAAGAVATTTSAALLERLWVPSAYAAGSLAGGGGGAPKAYVNFAINVQNFRYLSGSADVINSLCTIFEKYGAQGDFYMTGPMTRKYLNSHQDTIQALKRQGIAYHVRPPHPLFNHFDGRYKEVSGDQLANRIERFESHALNLSTGQLNDKAPGGFKLVRDTFRKAPSTVGAPNPNGDIKKAVLEYYGSQGAKAVVWYHGEKDLGANPYKKHYGLLARPCDIVIDEWKINGDKNPTLWWNRFQKETPPAAGYPHNRIKNRVASFTSKRPPHVVVLIHDDNFTRRGVDPWINTYWTDSSKSKAKSPPYDLDAKDPSSRRSNDERARITKAYEKMVEYCAENYRIVTMADIAAMA